MIPRFRSMLCTIFSIEKKPSSPGHGYMNHEQFMQYVEKRKRHEETPKEKDIVIVGRKTNSKTRSTCPFIGNLNTAVS
jgi:hypothetical protein